jgi:hypothetical protein
VLTLPRRAFLTGVLTVVAACRSSSEGDAATDASIGPLLAPGALAARLDDVKSGKVVVLYVGPDALFGHGHVPGARKIGAIDSDEGQHALAEVLAKVPVESEIVLYCGCCPVRNCPNVRPASAAIRALGRSNARVLDLPTRFSNDWTDKGYPIEHS